MRDGIFQRDGIFFIVSAYPPQKNTVIFVTVKKIQSEKNNVTVFSHRGYGVTVFCYQVMVFFFSSGIRA